MLDQLCHSWSVEGSNHLVFTSKMTKTKPSVRKGPGGMIRREQLATRDGRLPCVTVPRAVTVAKVKRNEACAPVCTAAAKYYAELQTLLTGKCLKVLLGRPSLLSTRRTGCRICGCYTHLGLGCCYGPDCSKRPPMCVYVLLDRLCCLRGEAWSVDQNCDARLTSCWVNQ